MKPALRCPWLPGAIALAACAGCASNPGNETTEPAHGAPRKESGASAPATPREFAFTTTEGYEFRGVIEFPPGGATRDSHAVLLLGGGLANDLDWTAPAAFTISGAQHADAPRISGALTGAGFVVARWSTIRVGDPLAAQWPDRATPYSYAQTLEQARSALVALRALGLVPPENVILLGHSLGANRALNIWQTDPSIAAVVCLSGADIARTCFEDRKQEFRGEVGRIFAEMDFTGDGRVEPWECDAWRPVVESDRFPALPQPAESRFDALEVDGDGVVRPWEIAATLSLLARASPELKTAETPEPRRAWGEDVLATRQKPALLVYGGLDPWAAQGVIVLNRAVREHWENVEVVILPGLGHNLGAMSDGAVGPISARSIDTVVAWLLARFAANK